jgi:hypothetical protein
MGGLMPAQSFAQSIAKIVSHFVLCVNNYWDVPTNSASASGSLAGCWTLLFHYLATLM